MIYLPQQVCGPGLVPCTEQLYQQADGVSQLDSYQDQQQQQLAFPPAMLGQMQQLWFERCLLMQQLQQPQLPMQMTQQMQSSQQIQPQQPQHQIQPQQIPAPLQQMQPQVQLQPQEHMHWQTQPQQEMQLPQQTMQLMHGQDIQLQQQVQQMQGGQPQQMMGMQQMQFMHAVQAAQMQHLHQNQLMQQTAQVHGQKECLRQQGSPDIKSSQDHVQQQHWLQQASPSFPDRHGHMQQAVSLEGNQIQQQRSPQLGNRQRWEDPQEQPHHSEEQSALSKPIQDISAVNNKPLGQGPLGSVAVRLPNEKQMSTCKVLSSNSRQQAATVVPVRPAADSAAAVSSAASSTGRAERKRNKRAAKEPHKNLSTGSKDREALDVLKRQLERGNSSEVAQALRGQVLRMTLESEGSCRIVQLALSKSPPHVAAELAKELKDNMYQAALSIHGNHVLQRIIELLPTTRWEFLVTELAENSLEIAKDVYGCRIFCRLAEQSINSREWQAIVESFLQQADSLARHRYGRFVAQSLLEYGTEKQKHRLAMTLLANLSDLAQDRNASHVVEKALIYCSNMDREQLATGLLYANHGEGEETGLSPLVKTQFGSYVVKALVAMSGSVAAEVRRQLALISAKQFKDKEGSKNIRIAERLLRELQTTTLLVAEQRHAA